jgi:hypothetical protein
VGELDAIRQRQKARATGALRAAAYDILGAAQRDAPVEEGTLRASGHVEIRETMDGATATISFATPYAARQHEETTWHHPRGGKAKYLEDQVLQRAPRIAKLMAAALRI